MMAVIIGFLAVSCQQSWLDEVTSAETDFVVNVAVPEDVTRSAGSNSALGAIGNIDLGEFDIRYILEVYDGNGTLAYGPLVNCEDTELATSFTLRLVPGRKYTFAVWADFVEQGKDDDYHYITADGLRNIEINEQNYNAMDESCDAFTGIAVIDNYNGTSTIDVELKRPFAKLRVVTSDINEMFNLTPSSVTVNYTSNSFYTEFDAYTSDVKGEPAALEGERVINLTEKRYENEPNPAESGVMTLFADYLFAKRDATAINFVMDVLDANGQPIPQVAFDTEIPVKRNNLTTIAGPILTDFNSVKVTIDPVFDGELEGILPTDNYDPRMVIRYTAPEKVENEDWTYSTFGANIIFHKFEDGKGAILFDGEVTKIGDSAFSDCSKLQSVTIPISVTKIGNETFKNCNSLTSVTIPSSVTAVGNNPFQNCSNLAEFKGKFASEDGKCLIVDGNLNAFAIGCGATEFTIPDSVTKIGRAAFWYCKSLTSVTIPNSVTYIGSFAFTGCNRLTSVTIPNSVTNIDTYAFYSCGGLTSITIPDSVTKIGDYAFSGCSSLAEFKGKLASEDGKCLIVDGNLKSFATGCGATEYTIPEGVTSIGYKAFEGCKSLTSVTIPSSVTAVGNSPFQNCSNLAEFKGKFASEDGKCLIVNGNLNAFAIGCGATEFTIPDGVTKIGWGAFWNCNSLTSVTIPNSVTYIGSFAFTGCNRLTSVTIPNSVTDIDTYAFYSCGGLTSITIPDSVTKIGTQAFSDCKNLTSVYCKATTPPSSGKDMFKNNASGRKIYVPAESVDAYKTASGWSNYASAIVGYDFN